MLLRYKQHSALKACFLSYYTPLDLPVSSDTSRFHNPELRFGSDQDHENQTVLKRCVGLQGNRGGKRQTNDFTDLCWNQSVCISVVFAVIYLEAFF